jgi:hypothetical protein
MKTTTVILVILVIASLAMAQGVPDRMNYQGVLTDGSGTAVPDGSYELQFSIYDTGVAGTALWTETNSVTVSGGIFSLIIGTTTPIDLPFDGRYWLGISVDGGKELSPRRELTTTPFAFNAKHVKGQYNVFGGTGSVGIGTPTPVERLEVDGGVKVGNTTGANEGTIRWSGSDFEGYDGASWVSLTSSSAGLPAGSNGQMLRHNGSNWVSNSTIYNIGSAVGIGTTNPTALLTVGGDVEIGSSTRTGTIEVFRDGVTTRIARVYSTEHGGGRTTSDEASNITTQLQCDPTGTGGTLYIKRNTSANGFYVEGNWAGTEEPGVGITGSARSVLFRMDSSDDESVRLPNNAIASAEMLDEPGVANSYYYLEHYPEPDISPFMWKSIVTPAAGYVLVIATAQVGVRHTLGTISTASFGVSDVDDSFPAGQEVAAIMDDANPSGTYEWPVTVHGVFEVPSAGSYTYYFISQEFEGIWRMTEGNLSLVFFPTAYGTVRPAAVADGISDSPRTGGLTAAEIAAERLESEAANRARVDRELAEMREQLRRLEMELAAERDGR